MSQNARILLTDVLTGGIAVTVAIAVAVLLGGFSFFAPWLIVSPVVLFYAGFQRGRSDGNAWAKGAAINVPTVALMLLAYSSTTFLNTAVTIVATFLALAFCSAAGIWLNRRGRNRQWVA